METPTDRSQTPQEPERSPRPPAEMPRGYFQPYCSCPPHDGPCRTADEEPTRSPRAAQRAQYDRRAIHATHATTVAICVPGNTDYLLKTTFDWGKVTCEECIQAINTFKADEQRSPELLDGRIREAVHWAQSPTMDDGTACRYAPPGEHDGSIITWEPTITIDPAQVTCAQCSNRLQSEPERREVNVTDIDPDLITALGDLTDTYGVAGVRKTMGILWPIEPVKLAAGGFVSGPQPVLVGEKDGPWLSLADHLELARGKTPQAEIEATADTPIDPADIHSDDLMLSAVVSEEVTPLTPVAEEIRVVLNRYSAEAPSGTPDYILANYLIDCLKAFNEAVSLRAVWRGEPIEQMILHIDKER